ncbi:lantibiotic dehydratase [Chitinophaga sp. RAB17]|uniref:lantibiotic dehydratase n=1 Tax=Chitinophaga sp. RAB17 TaxID=3233049 RepID=UPI003F9348E5
MKVFDYALLRIGGVPYEQLASLNAEELPVLLDRVRSTEEMLQSHRMITCDLLFDEIKRQEDMEVKRRCIELKRAIFNGRVVSPGKLGEISGLLDTNVLEAISLYLKKEQDAQFQQQEYKSCFDRQFAGMRSKFRKLLLEEHSFLNGVVFASTDLFDAVEKHLSGDLVANTRNALHTELSLLKYLSRTSLKTSPFSTFTATSFSQVLPKDSQRGYFNLESVEKFSVININNNILAHIRRVLLYYPPFYMKRRVFPNNTLLKKDNRLCFFLNIGNTESFQTLERSEITDFTLDILNGEEEISFAGLAERIENQFEVDDSAEIVRFLYRMIEIGVLQFDFRINRNDSDWLLNLGTYISSDENDEHLTRFGKRLIEIHSDIRSLEDGASAKFRRKLLDLIYKKLYDALDPLYAHLSIQPYEQYVKDMKSVEKVMEHRKPYRILLKRENLLYEDTFLKIPSSIDKQSMEEAAGLLRQLEQCFRYVDPSVGNRRAMYELFMAECKELAGMQVLEFFEKFELLKKEGKAADYRKIGETDYDTIVGNWLEKAINNIEVELQDTINLTARDILFEVPPELKLFHKNDINASHAAFIQFPFLGGQLDRESPYVVNGGILGGHGRLMGRFLNTHNHQHVVSSLKDICSSNEAYIFAEYDDNSYFNANLHPLLTDFEIEFLSEKNRCSPEKVLYFNSLVVKPDHASRNLMLFDARSGKQVFFLDLAFQDGRSRSSFYRFLDYFSNQDNGSFIPFVWKISDKAKRLYKDDTIVFTPRIVFEGRLILKRMSWQIQNVSFPQIDEKEPPADIYRKILEWKLSLNLPDTVFVTVERTEGANSRKDTKPQFIDFRSPYFAMLLYKYYFVEKTAMRLFVTESYPDTGSLMMVDGQSYVSEFLVQWS